LNYTIQKHLIQKNHKAVVVRSGVGVFVIVGVGMGVDVSVYVGVGVTFLVASAVMVSNIETAIRVDCCSVLGPQPTRNNESKKVIKKILFIIPPELSI
jgi:hypothetical protein